MDVSSHKIALRVAAQHAAKQAIELSMAVAAAAEQLSARGTVSGVDASWARTNMAAIRRELDDLEHLLAGQEPPVEAAPRAA